MATSLKRSVILSAPPNKPYNFIRSSEIWALLFLAASSRKMTSHKVLKSSGGEEGGGGEGE